MNWFQLFVFHIQNQCERSPKINFVFFANCIVRPLYFLTEILGNF